MVQSTISHDEERNGEGSGRPADGLAGEEARIKLVGVITNASVSFAASYHIFIKNE